MARVVLENVVKTYPDKAGGSVQIVRDANLTVTDGEFMVLVGPSGCGKSTTLRMIAGLEEISGGTISIGDRVINEVPPKDRDIAMVFQNYALYPHMSVYENLAFGLKLRKLPRPEIDARVREAAGLLGLEQLLDRMPRALSGGQRQRVAVGRAIVRKPKVFLFDEPLSNLDAKMRVSMRAEISKLHARLGATMIYVTHDQVEAMTMGDRICVMKDGCIQQVDDPLTVYHQPVNLFVAGFIGSPAMNLIEGTVQASAGHLVFVGPAQGEARVTIALNEALANQAARHLGVPVVFGIRPEDVRLGQAAPGTSPVTLTVDLVEPMGAETMVYLSAGPAVTIVARASADTRLEPGHQATVTFNLEHAHLFAASGPRLTV